MHRYYVFVFLMSLKVVTSHKVPYFGNGETSKVLF